MIFFFFCVCVCFVNWSIYFHFIHVRRQQLKKRKTTKRKKKKDSVSPINTLFACAKRRNKCVLIQSYPHSLTNQYHVLSIIITNSENTCMYTCSQLTISIPNLIILTQPPISSHWSQHAKQLALSELQVLEQQSPLSTMYYGPDRCGNWWADIVDDYTLACELLFRCLCRLLQRDPLFLKSKSMNLTN